MTSPTERYICNRRFVPLSTRHAAALPSETPSELYYEDEDYPSQIFNPCLSRIVD